MVFSKDVSAKVGSKGIAVHFLCLWKPLLALLCSTKSQVEIGLTIFENIISVSNGLLLYKFLEHTFLLFLQVDANTID